MRCCSAPRSARSTPTSSSARAARAPTRRRARFAAAVIAPDDDRTWDLALRGRHPDVIEIDPADNQIRVEHAQEIIDEAYSSPIEGDRKAIIVFEAERLNEAAANKLLKTLEEPPASVLARARDRRRRPAAADDPVAVSARRLRASRGGHDRSSVYHHSETAGTLFHRVDQLVVRSPDCGSDGGCCQKSGAANGEVWLKHSLQFSLQCNRRAAAVCSKLSNSLYVRYSCENCRDGGIGRRVGLRIQCPKGVQVQILFPAPHPTPFITAPVRCSGNHHRHLQGTLAYPATNPRSPGTTGNTVESAASLNV